MSKPNYMRNFIIASLTRLNADFDQNFGFNYIQPDDPEDDTDTAVKFGIITEDGNFVITISYCDPDSTFTLFIHNWLHQDMGNNADRLVKGELLVTSINWLTIAAACDGIQSLVENLMQTIPQEIKDALTQAGIMHSNLRPIKEVEELTGFQFQSATRRITIRIVKVGDGWALNLATPDNDIVYYRTFSEKLTKLVDHIEWYFGDMASPMHFTD